MTSKKQTPMDRVIGQYRAILMEEASQFASKEIPLLDLLRASRNKVRKNLRLEKIVEKKALIQKIRALARAGVREYLAERKIRN